MNLYKVTYQAQTETMTGTDVAVFQIIAESIHIVIQAHPTADNIDLKIKDVVVLGDKQPQNHKEYLEELRVNDLITYSELTSDPTGSSSDEMSDAALFCVYLVIGFCLGVVVGGFI